MCVCLDVKVLSFIDCKYSYFFIIFKFDANIAHRINLHYVHNLVCLQLLIYILQILSHTQLLGFIKAFDFRFLYIST